ncbi:MAG: hypothetical protein R3Y59_03995 [bacterium]
MATKTLIIKTQCGTKVDATDKWMPLEAADTVIEQIETSTGSETSSVEVFNTLISGVPSPWARVKLTSYALTNNADVNDHRTIVECYRHIKSEWRGLLSAYLLFSDRFTISEPIPLTHKSIEECYGRFDVCSMLGSMLLNDIKLWKHSSEVNNKVKSAPQIQMLYYTDRNYPRTLVGATSPQTLFFAAANYSIPSAANDIYWIDNSGKFTDPTSLNYLNYFQDEQVVNNIKKIVSFLKNVSSCRPSYTNELIQICGENMRTQTIEIEKNIGTFIESWLKDIHSIPGIGEELSKSDIPVSVNAAAKPSGPISKLFATNYTYYWFDGTFSTLTDKSNAIEITDIQKLFIDSNYIIGFKCSEDQCSIYDSAPVTYVKATGNKDDEYYYFALPFSKFAIEECMGTYISSIIANENDNVKLKLTVKSNMLKVVLVAKIAENWVDILSREYAIVQPDTAGHVFTWPNFASSIWNQYYFYSEYPSNASGIKVLPVFKSLDGVSRIDMESLEKQDAEGNRKMTGDDIEEMYVVQYPIGRVDTTEHRYEIMRSKYPVSFLSLKVDREEKECLGGYLMIKTQTDVSQRNNSMRVINMESAESLAKASVGIDFGSTNTCAYYNSKNEDRSVPIPFYNRRLALVGFDNPSRSLAQKNELLFISNEEPINKNGQIKSWLHEHNSLYYNVAQADRELVGGIPINETNITVKSITENVITTNAGTLCSNMKWLSDAKGKSQKKSYMRTIWMQICADLFDKGIRPSELYWSYPSAMNSKDIGAMKQIYNELRSTPIDGVVVKSIKNHTESEAVCSYAMTKDVALTKNRLFLGIDIGGSTSDILILGRPNDSIKLFSQCSIRMAANHFFKAINSSPRFRQSLHKFHASRTTNVKVINIEDVISTDASIYTRSPYYLNNVFDQLNGATEFTKFYNSLNQGVPFVFALPSYVTGILVYYSGLLVRKAIKDNNLENIDNVHMRYYGKGGRTFEWIYNVYEDDARSFYTKCFRAGFGNDTIKFKCDNIDDEDNSRLENKSEVAMGLVNLNSNISGIYEADEDDINGTPVEFMSEVFGECGFSYNVDGKSVEIDELDIVDGKFYQTLNNPSSFENFFKFMSIYTKFLEVTGIINEISDIQTLRTKKDSIDNVMQFFDNDKEYKKYIDEYRNADSDSKPSYRMPIFIAEALYYLEKVLIPNVFNE